MFQKSRLLIAATIVVGSAAFASAQSANAPYDEDNMIYYAPVVGQSEVAQAQADARAAATAAQRGAPMDEDDMIYYGRPSGTSAYAQAPAAAPSGHPFDEDDMIYYGNR